MRIVLFSHAFSPSVGGIETMSETIAQEFVELGHDVTVVTRTTLPTDLSVETTRPYRVVRRPSPLALLRIVRQQDIALHNNPCIRYLWATLLTRTPWVCVVATWLRGTSPASKAKVHFKHLLLRNASNLIAVSPQIARHLRRASITVPNSYRPDLFTDLNQPRHQRSVGFVGRLVSDKGADLLLEAIALLNANHEPITLHIIGDGPELSSVRDRALQLGISESTIFYGSATPQEINRILNEIRVLVVPSRWAEPFGVVALEGIAAGCEVIVSDGGGLPFAVGDCGVTFPSGDVDAMATTISNTLAQQWPSNEARAKAVAHLSRHTPRRMTLTYLEVLERSVRERRPRKASDT